MENLSVFRSENKYVIDEIQSMKLEETLSKLLKQDEHNKDGGYLVRSLYFDSINNIDFHTKLAGTEIRKKIRLRVYSPDDSKCKLEIKMKNGDMQHKISIWIKKKDAIELIDGNYSVLFKYFKEDGESAIKIYKTMQLGCYKPVVLIEYNRIAYIYPENNTRITIDKQIKSSESNFNLFDKEPTYTSIFTNKSILEVKYDEKLVQFISKTLKNYNLTRVSLSKYCMGRKNFYSFFE